MTPDAEALVGYLARVSNPDAQPGDNASKLIRYLIDHNHWSPFEMVSACVEINTTRDITHQLIRHRSFSFQEFSGRYASYDNGLVEDRECRLQDPKNRQSSLPCKDERIAYDWMSEVDWLGNETYKIYKRFLSLGVAKEVARSILPEGLVPSKLYMAGTLRSWIHYWGVRCTPETQKEHRDVAIATREILLSALPSIAQAIGESQGNCSIGGRSS